MDTNDIPKDAGQPQSDGQNATVAVYMTPLWPSSHLSRPYGSSGQALEVGKLVVAAMGGSARWRDARRAEPAKVASVETETVNVLSKEGGKTHLGGSRHARHRECPSNGEDEGNVETDAPRQVRGSGGPRDEVKVSRGIEGAGFGEIDGNGVGYDGRQCRMDGATS
ncbi:hypothetical protein L210DRAFT_3507525 [Boletus edulis BED1]|uniref:Uncharacterized protein n=1 Tax=Boletus edulis BED1 TaxID=1328754 RepID=A0AAD4BK23_BOLED|nr:hypothetical protein L210DRAFT_3507525 [Boletus edulis BED1]